jgi:DNA-binding NtrC family response regulator
VNERVLIVEDEAAIRLALSGLLRREGYEVAQAESGEKAIETLRAEPVDLVITDLALGPGASGMDVLRETATRYAGLPVVMITAHGSEKVAVDAMKLGAADYIPKPFDNDEIRLVVRRALEHTRLTRENRLLRDRVERAFRFDNLIGSGPGMRRVFDTIRKVAETDLTLLVRGESGTGKELVAEAAHQHSARREGPFVAVNCAAISRELVESELFGHEKGAFTGADAKRKGRFEAAHGGTIFLDEIGDMAPETQAKVLRVLQERRFERVGSTQPVEVDVRIIAATHRDLEADVKTDRFREDLYYRLKVVEIEIPALRERREDIPALVDQFLSQLAERLGRPPRAIRSEALARLARHDWPGNVRELRNVVEQAAVLAAGEAIEVEDLRLPDATDGAVSGPALPDAPFADAKRQVMGDFERSYLLAALRRHGGNISRTAAAIGMVRQSLQQKIRELELRSEDWGNGDGADPGK